jgi:hypothetical protein
VAVDVVGGLAVDVAGAEVVDEVGGLAVDVAGAGVDVIGAEVEVVVVLPQATRRSAASKIEIITKIARWLVFIFLLHRFK